MAKEKSHYYYYYYFSLTPTIFLSQTVTLCSLHFSPYFLLNAQLSLSHAVLILPNGRMATINTFNLFTSFACETHSMSLPKKMERRLCVLP